ncbi:hypothetical protein F5B19DRAFT_72069 [Rostrohypoxylon terebratum]|nr:hypothetical protein F5B19DRAFT_72069 [Rostrohypoxylon terebratum]
MDQIYSFQGLLNSPQLLHTPHWYVIVTALYSAFHLSYLSRSLLLLIHTVKQTTYLVPIYIYLAVCPLPSLISRRLQIPRCRTGNWPLLGHAHLLFWSIKRNLRTGPDAGIGSRSLCFLYVTLLERSLVIRSTLSVFFCSMKYVFQIPSFDDPNDQKIQ